MGTGGRGRLPTVEDVAGDGCHKQSDPNHHETEFDRCDAPGRGDRWPLEHHGVGGEKGGAGE